MIIQIARKLFKVFHDGNFKVSRAAEHETLFKMLQIKIWNFLILLDFSGLLVFSILQFSELSLIYILC